jgi:hypothetical protein
MSKSLEVKILSAWELGGGRRDALHSVRLHHDRANGRAEARLDVTRGGGKLLDSPSSAGNPEPAGPGRERNRWFRQLSRYAAEIMSETEQESWVPGRVFPAKLSCEIAVPMTDLEFLGAQENESMK